MAIFPGESAQFVRVAIPRRQQRGEGMIAGSHEKLKNENRDAECIIVLRLVPIREPSGGLRRNGVGITDIAAVGSAVTGNLKRIRINQANFGIAPTRVFVFDISTTTQRCLWTRSTAVTRLMATSSRNA